MMIRSIHAVTLGLVTLCPLAQGHMLWQQSVQDSNGESISTLFTFAENPGLAQAEPLTQKAYKKGVHVYMKGIGEYDALKEISTSLEGKYIKGQLPDSISKSPDGKPLSYALESFCRMGTWAEGDEPPSLIFYYTSASRAVNPSDFDKVKNASQNRFSLSLVIEDNKILCEDAKNSNRICVAAIAEYDGSPLPDHNIYFLDGNTGDEIDKSLSNSDGVAYISVSANSQRVFARVNHKIENAGKTDDGEKYDSISNWATSVLEIRTSFSESPLGKEAKSSETKTNSDESGSNLQDISFSSVLWFVGLMALCGSFVGGFLSGKVNHHMYHSLQQEQADEEVNLKIKNAEKC